MASSAASSSKIPEVHIRPAVYDDIEKLQEVERSARRAFITFNRRYGNLANANIYTTEGHTDNILGGLTFVAVTQPPNTKRQKLEDPSPRKASIRTHEPLETRRASDIRKDKRWSTGRRSIDAGKASASRNAASPTQSYSLRDRSKLRPKSWADDTVMVDADSYRVTKATTANEKLPRESTPTSQHSSPLSSAPPSDEEVDEAMKKLMAVRLRSLPTRRSTRQKGKGKATVIPIDEDGKTDQGEIVGFLIAHLLETVSDEVVVYVELLMVSQEHQNKRIGSKLLSTLFSIVDTAVPTSLLPTLSMAQMCELQKWHGRAISLLTYNFPWDGPWYMKNGFVELPLVRGKGVRSQASEELEDTLDSVRLKVLIDDANSDVGRTKIPRDALLCCRREPQTQQ